MPEPAADRPVSLTFFPDYRAANPMQGQIYDRLGPRIVAQPGGVESLTGGGAPRPLFHLHWEDAILREPRARAEAFLDRLLEFRAGGGRVIWSLHNLASHDAALEPRVQDLRAGLFDLADRIHLHSLSALAAARERWDLPLHKLWIVPHPSYDGLYPMAGRGGARDALGLSEARMVLLCPGRIAAYKQPERLIAAFQDLAGPLDHLILAGQPEPSMALTSSDPRIRVIPGQAVAAKVAELHAAADLIVLPYAQSLTSGSAILAATLGRAVLGPESPGLRDAVEQGRGGILYPPDALPEALAEALAEGPEAWAARGALARAAMAGRDPRVVAAIWADLFLTLARDRP